jgi:hypothetical protein
MYTYVTYDTLLCVKWKQHLLLFDWVGQIVRNCECRNPSFGLATKAKGLQGCGPRGSPRVNARGSPGVTSHTPESVRKCEGVWGNEHSHSQSNSHFGKWSPGELPKLQRAIWGVKTQWLVMFFISLESSWNVDVYKGLALFIWTSET